jgi:hypothetical protein
MSRGDNKQLKIEEVKIEVQDVCMVVQDSPAQPSDIFSPRGNRSLRKIDSVKIIEGLSRKPNVIRRQFRYSHAAHAEL